MNLLVKATPAPKPRTKESRQMAILLAGILTVFAVAQLFTFDDFMQLFAAFELPLPELLIYSLAPLLILTEIATLPFLLGMALSPAFRWLSMIAGWCGVALWTLLTTWVVFAQPDVYTVGYLGTAVTLVPGWWALSITFALVILTIWSSWGLWPGTRRK